MQRRFLLNFAKILPLQVCNIYMDHGRIGTDRFADKVFVKFLARPIVDVDQSKNYTDRVSFASIFDDVQYKLYCKEMRNQILPEIFGGFGCTKRLG